jgi:nucleolar protein 56
MDDEEDKRQLHENAMRLAREKLAESLAGEDAYLVQAVKALDDLNEAYNIISERLSEWYGIHYPEKRMRPGDLIESIIKCGIEGEASSPNPLTDPEELEAIRGLTSAAKSISDERKALEDYISHTMKKTAPNLTSLLGAVLGARLIARAGSLEKLARMPSSSIQVMGAGEALFKHLRDGTPSPKHGLIYKHPLISGAPKKARGKMSRMLAGRAAIAARVDYFSGEAVDIGNVKEKAADIKNRARGKK